MLICSAAIDHVYLNDLIWYKSADFEYSLYYMDHPDFFSLDTDTNIWGLHIGS